MDDSNTAAASRLHDKCAHFIGLQVNTYLAAIGREARHTAVIQSNPDQSKHLETARMKIGNVWIDLVNLRSETYAADSRIPEMTFGSPEQVGQAYLRFINHMCSPGLGWCLIVTQ